MKRQVSLYEAKTHLSQLVEDAARGDVIVVTKNGKPKAQIVVADAPEEKPKRVGGQWAKYLTPEQLADIGSENWMRRWKEADEEILRDFEESLNRPLDQSAVPLGETHQLGEPERNFKWDDTSSTPTPSSISKRSKQRSAKKRGKSSGTRKTKSS